jgi:hypothetical protein
MGLFTTASILMNSQKVVTPVKTGVQIVCNYLKRLDSANASLRARLSPE